MEKFIWTVLIMTGVLALGILITSAAIAIHFAGKFW